MNSLQLRDLLCVLFNWSLKLNIRNKQQEVTRKLLIRRPSIFHCVRFLCSLIESKFFLPKNCLKGNWEYLNRLLLRHFNSSRRAIMFNLNGNGGIVVPRWQPLRDRLRVNEAFSQLVRLDYVRTCYAINGELMSFNCEKYDNNVSHA